MNFEFWNHLAAMTDNETLQFWNGEVNKKENGLSFWFENLTISSVNCWNKLNMSTERVVQMLSIELK